ncbi:hypothetical protein KKA93_03655 [Patescibacteria group bacterium]|nr:hypothetical protein [Patescibacteria group bacterium]MBU1663586.1 hypothetical protein [Patescibacteria group bacterium]MBU1934137.1 hypothetical protein [Patescibacteria group bacterium]MBU2234001.1 hypothetical protein [Patescibacteria group bacterium]
MSCINEKDLENYAKGSLGFAKKDRFGHEIRRHLETCESCREFVAAKVREQEQVKIVLALSATAAELKAQAVAELRKIK